MHERPSDLRGLQVLLDSSYAQAGPHLRSVITPERRLAAAALAERLQGVCLLALATVTADGRPLVGPVDGIFYRGAFHFSSSADSVRLRHIERRPWVSATHVPGEELAVTVHGTAARIDLRREPAFRQAVLEVYRPRYGAEFERFLDTEAVYARIAAERMFTFQLTGS